MQKILSKPDFLTSKFIIMGISRRLPQSTTGFWTAIQKAKQKKDNPPAYGNILTAPTTTRLDAIFTSFSAARNVLAVKKALSALATTAKNSSLARLTMMNSHYIQVLNMKIARNDFPAAYRSFYNIPASSSAVPSQVSEAAVAQLANNIITGEPAMIAAGGVAIPFPTLAEVTSALNTFNHAEAEQSNKMEDTDAAEEALDALIPEASGVVRKIWDEVETYFNEETIESKRANAREWGVVYVSDSAVATVTGRVVQIAGGVTTPVNGATVLIIETEESVTTAADGLFSITSDGLGEVTVHFTAAGFADKDVVITLTEGVDVDMGDVEMVV